MPSDCHSLHLHTQVDKSLKGTHEYYYECYSMFSNRDYDGWRKEEVSFASLQELKEHVTSSLSIRYDAGVFIDGIKLEKLVGH